MMNTLTNRLLSPGSDKAAGALADIVGNVGEFNKLLKEDANEALTFFLDQIAKMDKFSAAEGLTDFLGQGFADETLRLAVAMDELRRNLAIGADRGSWFDGLSRTYKLKLDDFWSQWQIFKNKFNEAVIDVGTMGLPAAKTAIEGLSSAASAFRQEIEAAEFDAEPYRDARNAIVELAEVLDIDWTDTGMDDLREMFEDIAGLVETIANGIKNTAEFIRDPVGYVQSTEAQEEAKRKFADAKDRSARINQWLEEWLPGEGLFYQGAEHGAPATATARRGRPSGPMGAQLDRFGRGEGAILMPERPSDLHIPDFWRKPSRATPAPADDNLTDIPLRDGLVDVPLPMPNPRAAAEISAAAGEAQSAANSIRTASQELPAQGSEAGRAFADFVGRALNGSATTAGAAFGDAAAARIRAASPAARSDVARPEDL